MADTTIQNITLQGDGKAFIRDNVVRKESFLTPMPLYTFDSDETDVYDFGGVVKTLTLTGVYIDTTEANVKTFVDSVENLVNGLQDKSNNAPYKFVDDRRTTSSGIKVKIAFFDSTFVEGWPTGCIWILKLINSSDNA